MTPEGILIILWLLHLPSSHTLPFLDIKHHSGKPPFPFPHAQRPQPQGHTRPCSCSSTSSCVHALPKGYRLWRKPAVLSSQPLLSGHCRCQQHCMDQVSLAKLGRADQVLCSNETFFSASQVQIAVKTAIKRFQGFKSPANASHKMPLVAECLFRINKAVFW